MALENKATIKIVQRQRIRKAMNTKKVKSLYSYRGTTKDPL